MDELPPIEFPSLSGNSNTNTQENCNKTKENSQNHSPQKSHSSKHLAPESLEDSVISLDPPEESSLPPLDSVLSSLDDTKLDSLLTLFNIQLTGTRQEKMQIFAEQAFPEYSEVVPDLVPTLILFIQQLSVNGDISSFILSPPVPFCMAHADSLPFCTKPIQYYKAGFTLEVPVTPGKTDNNAIIATIISPFQTNSQSLPIYVNGKEIYPCSFGEEGHSYYVLYSNKRSIKSVQVSFPPVFESIFAFFTIHFCIKKPVETVMKNILRNIGIAYDSEIDLKDLYAKSRKCRCKSFKFQQFVKDTIDSGTCKCPLCGCDLLLSEISIELRKREVSNVDRDHDISIAAPNLAKTLLYLTKPNNEPILTNALFGDITDTLDDDKWVPNQCSINGGIEAYIKSFDDLILQK